MPRLACVLLGLVLSAGAAAQTTEFDIPAGPLNAALAAFGKQADVQVNHEPALSEGKRSGGVVGQYTPPAALQRLLQGSGISSHFTDGGTVTLAQAPQTSEEILAPITVEGAAAVDIWREPLSGYQAPRARTATRTDTEVLNTPASVQVVPENLIKDQQADDITDIYRTISGVSANIYNQAAFRGFRQNAVRYNGLMGSPYPFISVADLFNVQRLEVLKGPAGVLYGIAEPGGILNYITKKPSEQFRGEFKLSAGAYDGFSGSPSRSLSVDLSGPLDDDGEFLYRIAGKREDRDGFRNNSKFDNNHFAGGITWNAGPATRLTLETEYIDRELGGHRLRGVPVDDDGDFIAGRGFSVNEPGDAQTTESEVVQLRLDHVFDNGLQLDSTVRYVSSDSAQNYHDPQGLRGDGRTVNREFRIQDRSAETLAWNANLIYDWRFAGFDHKLLAGVNYTDIENTSAADTAVGQELGGPVPPIDILDPQYGQSNPATFSIDPDARASKTLGERYGLYLQDQINLNERWIAVLGARFDAFDDRAISAEAGGSSSDTSFSDEDFNLRGGVIYKPTAVTSIYGQYATGFTPQTPGNQSQRVGGPFDPQESEQFEAGVKWEPLGRRLRVTLAAYQITKTNQLQPDPDPPASMPDRLTPLGEVRSRGVEFNLVGNPLPNWRVSLAYAYNDIEITEDNDPANIGDPPPNAPENTLGLFTRYDIPETGTGFGLGVDYVDERPGFGFASPAFVADGYTVVDLFLYQKIGSVDATLGLHNAFDEKYLRSNFGVGLAPGGFPGAPRALTVSLDYDF